MNPESCAASVVIATKNRVADLRNALRSVAQQSIPVETIVCDDGSTDDTASMVRHEFPQVRLITDGASHGYIVRRNQLAELSTAPVIFSIDDDAIFSTPHIVEQTLRDFDQPRVGAVAIPYINVNQDDIVRQRARSRETVDVLPSYIGTAHALRRELFLSLGGYRSHLVHQGEEGDYCLRMLDRGMIVRAGRADPIHHFESPRRSYQRMDYYGRRNDVLFTWHNCPRKFLPGRMSAVTLGGLAFGFRVGRPVRMLYGLVGGYAACFRHFRERRAVSAGTYLLYRELVRAGRLPLDSVSGRLPDFAET